MIVTCPSCSVRYLVDARALGPTGRTVRCARCSHTWHETPPPGEAIAAATATAAATDKPATAAADAGGAAAAPPAKAGESALGAADAAPTLAAERRIQLPALTRRKPHAGLVVAWTVTGLAVVAGLLYVGTVERARIVALVPGANGLYARLGLAPEPKGAGLEFRNLTTSREVQNGLPAIVIGGDVTNVSTVPRDVPPLVVSLRDDTDRDLQDVTVPVERTHLAPGETEPFRTTITQPAEATVGVKVTFAAGNPG